MLFIAFIAYDDEWEFAGLLRTDMFQETILPFGEVLECFSSREIEAQGAAVGSSIKCISNRLIFLLPGGVPNLNSDNSIINDHFLLLEVSSDSGLHVLWVLSLGVSHQQ